MGVEWRIFDNTTPLHRRRLKVMKNVVKIIFVVQLGWWFVFFDWFRFFLLYLRFQFVFYIFFLKGWRQAFLFLFVLFFSFVGRFFAGMCKKNATFFHFIHSQFHFRPFYLRA